MPGRIGAWIVAGSLGLSACGSPGSQTGVDTNAETSRPAGEPGAEGGCSATHVYSPPEPGAEGLKEAASGPTSPEEAAGDFVAEGLAEFEVNPALASARMRGDELLMLLESDPDALGSTVGTEDGAALGAASRYGALTSLEAAFRRSTVAVEHNEERGQAFTYSTKEPSGEAWLVVVEWGTEEWVVESFGHTIPDTECVE